jgi:Sigma-70, region 4
MTHFDSGIHECHDLIRKELNCHSNLIERLLYQMRLRHKYEKGDIINELFISFQKKIAEEAIKVEHDIYDGSIYFISRNREGEWKRIISPKGYFRTTIENYLRRLYEENKNSTVSVDSDLLENIISKTQPDRIDIGDDEDLRFQDIREKLQLLSYEDHKILELFFQGLSYQEIAQYLKSSGLPPDGRQPYNENNLRKKKQRALEKLRELY